MMRTLMIIATLAMFLFGAAQAQTTIQAIHGAADPGLDTVDVYVGIGAIPLTVIQDISYSSANPTIESTVNNTVLDFGIAPGNSTARSDTVANFPVFIAPDSNYIGLFRGVVDPSGFAPNPDGREISLGVSFTDQGRLQSTTTGSVEIIVFHASTDAPTIDITTAGGSVTVVDDLAYGDVSAYVPVTPGIAMLEIRDASGANVLFSLQADLSAYADSTLSIIASGFLDPSMNQNGPAFSVDAISVGGTRIPFGLLTGIGDDENQLTDYRLLQNYPNPFNPTTTIEFSIPQNERVELTIYNALGETVETLVRGTLSAGEHSFNWDAANRASGVYYYQLTAGAFNKTGKMLLMK